MVSEKKKLAAKQLAEELKRYPIIGIVDMFKLPAKQLQEIKDSLRGKAIIKMTKKNTIKLAIDGAKIESLKRLETEIKNQPALLLSDVNPFELASIIESSKSSAAAKAGDIVVKDIVISAGPTSLKPGPVIGELQRVKLPAGVEGDKIVIKKDTVIVKEGETITKPVADVLMKLGIEPLEISLNLLAVHERGVIYDKSLLFIPAEKYRNDIISAYQNAFSLSFNTGYPTIETLPFLLAKAYREALSLASEAGTQSENAEKPEAEKGMEADEDDVINEREEG